MSTNKIKPSKDKEFPKANEKNKILERKQGKEQEKRTKLHCET